MVLENDMFYAFRSSCNYISLFVVTYVCYFFMNKYGIINYNFFKVSVIIWFAVGMIQTFFNPTFLLFLQPRDVIYESFYGDRGGRGVLGFAPEPTYYGLVCLQFLLFAILNYLQRKNIFRYIFLQINLFLMMIMNNEVYN